MAYKFFQKLEFNCDCNKIGRHCSAYVFFGKSL